MHPSYTVMTCVSNIAFWVNDQGRLILNSCIIVFKDRVTFYLRYLYTSEEKFENVSNEKLMYLAEKYEVRELMKHSLETQLCIMRPEEFCPFVNKYQDHMSDVVKFKCLEYVFIQPYPVFQSGTFQQLPLFFLIELLGHERLVLQEDDICTAVLVWASKRCELNGKEVNGANQREALSKALYLVRFPLLSQGFFTENISDKGLLSEHEENQILKYFLNKKTVDLFSTNKREAPSTPFEYVAARKLGLKCGLHQSGSRAILSPELKSDLKYVHRFTERGVEWGYRPGSKDAIAFVVDKDIVLTHVYIYGSCKEKRDIDVQMVVRDNYDQEISCTELKVCCDAKNDTGLYEVGVENSTGSYGVHLLPQSKYHIVLSMEGVKTTYYGKGGLEECDHDGVHFEFRDSEFSSNKTNIKNGQIAGMKFNFL